MKTTRERKTEGKKTKVEIMIQMDGEHQEMNRNQLSRVNCERMEQSTMEIHCNQSYCGDGTR